MDYNTWKEACRNPRLLDWFLNLREQLRMQKRLAQVGAGSFETGMITGLATPEESSPTQISSPSVVECSHLPLEEFYVGATSDASQITTDEYKT